MGDLGRWIRRSSPGVSPADILRWIWRRASSQFSTVVADWCIVDAVAQTEVDVAAAAQSQWSVDAAAQSVWSAPAAKVVSCG